MINQLITGTNAEEGALAHPLLVSSHVGHSQRDKGPPLAPRVRFNLSIQVTTLLVVSEASSTLAFAVETS